MRVYIIILTLVVFALLSAYPLYAEKYDSLEDWVENYVLNYQEREKECLGNGWKKITTEVAGIKRQLLWKGPKNSWKNGAIIVLHGGGGSYYNFCSNIKLGEPMIEFADLAMSSGFAVFALDSTDGLAVDDMGRSCGKRFDSIAQDIRDNIDLPFIEYVIDKIIPKQRTSSSAKDVFIAGISNGGFMTTLAATHFDDKISAFVLVSTADPYGTYINCDKSLTIRRRAPGKFYDNETNMEISGDNACLADNYLNEKKWHTTHLVKKPSFKQFHHEGDDGVDISCMKKAQRMLIKHGYKDDGPYIVKNTGKKNALKHFWLRAYNGPLINFLIRQVAIRD